VKKKRKKVEKKSVKLRRQLERRERHAADWGLEKESGR